MNWRSLLMAALAFARLGDEREARRLEEFAAAIIPPHASLGQEPAFLRLLLQRGDLDARQARARRRSGCPTCGPTSTTRPPGSTASPRSATTPQVEAEAPPLLRAGGYGEPFALRALGRARGDRSLVELAAARFEAMGLGWHAHETRALP